MANNFLGMLIGAAIDRRDGDSGVKGALEGYLVEGAIKAAIPLAITFAIGWGVQKGLRKGLSALSTSLEAQKARAQRKGQGQHATRGQPI